MQRVEELNDVQSKDSGQRQQMITMVAALNNQVKGLNLTYDAETDKLNMTTEAMKLKGAAAADTMRYMAQQELYNGLIEEEVRF